jgi:hypothetical protein
VVNLDLPGGYTPRHVPDKIMQMGVPLEKAANASAMADPAALGQAGFALPSQIAEGPGAENWRSMYRYYVSPQNQDPQPSIERTRGDCLRHALFAARRAERDRRRDPRPDAEDQVANLRASGHTVDIDDRRAASGVAWF